MSAIVGTVMWDWEGCDDCKYADECNGGERTPLYAIAEDVLGADSGATVYYGGERRHVIVCDDYEGGEEA